MKQLFLSLPRLILACWAVAAMLGLAFVIRLYPVADVSPLWFFAFGAAVLVAPIRDNAKLTIALLLGLIVRLILSESPPIYDAVYYDQIAKNLLAGKGLTVSVAPYGVDQRAMFPPLYPLFLALSYALGISAAGLGAAIDAAASALIYRMTGKAWAAGAYFLFPTVILSSVSAGKEGLAVALVLACVAIIRHPFAFGLVTGLLALTQPAWIPLPCFALLIIDRRPQSLAKAATGVLLIMTPWWIRNAIVFHAFVPLTSGGGLVLAFMANGGKHLAPPLAGELLGSASAGAKAIAVIASDPVSYFLLVAKRTVLALTIEDAGVSRLAVATWTGAAALSAQFAWAALLAVSAWRVRFTTDVNKAFVFGAGLTIAIGVWLEFSGRHRAFLVPLGIVAMAMSKTRTGSETREPSARFDQSAKPF